MAWIYYYNTIEAINTARLVNIVAETIVIIGGWGGVS